jgi:hypothetical protein
MPPPSTTAAAACGHKRCRAPTVIGHDPRPTNRSAMDNHEEVARPDTLRLGAAGAAMLEAWGCPRAAVTGGHLVLPERFEHFGVALIDRIGVDDAGTAHELGCDSAPSLHTPRSTELASLSSRPGVCACNGAARAVVPAGAAPVFVVCLTRLTHRLGRASAEASAPGQNAPVVVAEVCAAQFAGEVARMLKEFLDCVVAPSGFIAVVDQGLLWAGGYADRQIHSLRRHGLQRLTTALRAGLGPTAWTAASQRRQAATARAEDAVPGVEDDEVACMFVGVEPLVAAAAVAVPAAAVRRTGTFLVPDTAVVVLPRAVAVLLHAHLQLSRGVARSELVACHVVEFGHPGLRQVCEAALLLWGDGGRGEPEHVWSAALSAMS